MAELPKPKGLPSLPTPKLPRIPGQPGDLNSSDGLYDLAKSSGFKEDADKIVALHSGEQHKTFFAGGVISDVFDVLNVASYGVVGTLKGKGFYEGIKNRESFSDQDALGRYGLTGVVAGIVLDIATDPFTYIAPWKALSKVPGLAKGVKTAKEAVFGNLQERTIDESGKSFQDLVGGNKQAKWLADKVVWMFGQDPVYKETYERMQRSLGIGLQHATQTIKGLAKLDSSVSEKLLVRDETGRFARKNIDQLQNELSSDEFAFVKPVWDNIDKLGKELVDLGVLGKNKFEENFGTYLKNAYTEFEFAKEKNVFKAGSIGIKGSKSRVEGLTQEKMSELGQIDNPNYLLLKTMLDMTKDVENAKFFKSVNGKFAVNGPREGFTKVPDTKRFQRSVGAVAELRDEVGKINDQLNPLFAELKQTFRGDKILLKELNSIEKEVLSLRKKEARELTDFFGEGGVVLKTTTKPRSLGTIPDRLSEIGNKTKAFKSFSDLEKSSVGIQLEKLFVNGDLERAGFKTMEDFYDAAKGKFKPEVTKEGEGVMIGNLPKIIAFQKRIENLLEKSTRLKDIDKKSINDSFINLERQISDLKFGKEDLLAQIEIRQLGDLAGKYVPESMIKSINEVVKLTESGFGEHLVAEFKYMKVVLSPSTHIRNVLSNQILNWWKLGIGPWRQDLYFEALNDIRTKNKWYDRAQKAGLGASTYAANELRGLLDDPEMNIVMKGYGVGWKKVKQVMGDIYQEEENWAKLVAFKEGIKKGFSDDEAWKMAESATFNYAQVTPFIRKLRTSIWGVPFITFPLKATPIAVETALKNTPRVSFFGKLRTSIENLSDQKELEKEREKEPAYIRDGFFIKLPIKDKEGRSAYFDLTYIVPFGDLVTGQILSRQVSRETGLKESVPSAIASANPTLNFIKEIMNNQDFYGNKILRESDPVEKQISDVTRHLMKTFVPPWLADQMPGGYGQDGTRIPTGFDKITDPNKRTQQTRTFAQEISKYLGFKVQPFDAEVQSSINESNKKKGLRQLLLDNNVVANYSNVYQPKE